MAAVAYGLQHSFAPSSYDSMNSEPPPEDVFTALFCRALYDYTAQDPSALSFKKGDLIEILTQQASGWWDGLLGDERGWFPSNYVTILSEEEAELALSGSDFSNADSHTAGINVRSSVIDMSDVMMRGSQEENEHWLDSELRDSRTLTNGTTETAHSSWESGNSSSDFWMPQVASNGQIYYVNTKTGQHSRDLPLETDEDASDSDVAGLTSQSSSRSGTSAGLGYHAGSAYSEPGTHAGFGVNRRTGTPEPWIKKLADDGMSYFYYNPVDGSVMWTRPEPTAATSNLSSSSQERVPMSDVDDHPSTLQTSQTTTNRLSVYSDNSDVQPVDADPVHSLLNGRADHKTRSLPRQGESIVMQLTSAEKIAQSLQQALAPPPPELITDLSAVAKASVQEITDMLNLNGISWRPEQDAKLDELIHAVVSSVRNLLYVSALPGHAPSDVLPAAARDTRPSHPQSPLKPAQRKVTATLSRLVLSARAMQYDSGSSVNETLARIANDADELEKAVLSFVLEAQRIQHTALPDIPDPQPLRRLRGTFITANIGLGLVGAGAGGSWRGFGWVSRDNPSSSPLRTLSVDVVNESSAFVSQLDEDFSTLTNFARALNRVSVDQVWADIQALVTRMNNFLTFVTSIHVARHVDIDGIRQEGNPDDMYTQTVDTARGLVRRLEISVQALFDDSSTLFLSAQSIKPQEQRENYQERDVDTAYIEVLSTSLKANLALVQQTLEGLLSIGHDQAELGQGDYNGSIEWRMSRLSVIDTQFGGALRPTASGADMYDGQESEDVVDMELAFSKPGMTKPNQPGGRYDTQQFLANESQPTFDTKQSTSSIDFGSSVGTIVGEETSEDDFEADDEVNPLFDDETPMQPNMPLENRGKKAEKLRKLMGEDLPAGVVIHAEAQLGPWYLRPNTNPAEILIEPDGSVRGGTLPALVERLTAHNHADTTYVKAFLMTFKSFMTLDELFDLLVQRFYIQPPPKLTPAEREEWGKLKQTVVQQRVLNIFKTIIVEQGTLEKEDMYILARMKEFVTSEDVTRLGAAKQLQKLIDRAQNGGDAMKMIVNSQGTPPPPIIPRVKGKLKLLDIEPLELARQLTLFESALYQKIKPMECLQRAREQKTENMDNIAIVIQTSNRIADWVAESVLSKEDSRKRATTVKHLINIADRCRTLNNFSTMIAITSGLNTPPIRRLKRTWEQVSQRYMAQFGACEMTIDSNKNFYKYRLLMATVNPPCIPFIGVFLSTLQFIQDGNPDTFEDGLVNFKKRQKASEVISDIKRWQAQSFNFISIPVIQTYIEESLSQFNDTKGFGDRFWALSLEREPREREDEKMARLLQESGFL